SLADTLLKVHRSYLRPIRALIEAKLLKGAAHITGGGITDNTPRMLPSALCAEIRLGSWPVLPIFERLKAIGKIPEDDYRRTFNLGIGMILAVARRNLEKAWSVLDRLEERAYEVGVVVESKGKRVMYVD